MNSIISGPIIFLLQEVNESDCNNNIKNTNNFERFVMLIKHQHIEKIYKSERFLIHVVLQ